MDSIGLSPSCARLHRLMRRGVPEDVRVEREQSEREKEKIVSEDEKGNRRGENSNDFIRIEVRVCQAAKYTYEKKREEGNAQRRWHLAS